MGRSRRRSAEIFISSSLSFRPPIDHVVEKMGGGLNGLIVPGSAGVPPASGPEARAPSRRVAKQLDPPPDNAHIPVTAQVSNPRIAAQPILFCDGVSHCCNRTMRRTAAERRLRRYQAAAPETPLLAGARRVPSALRSAPLLAGLRAGLFRLESGNIPAPTPNFRNAEIQNGNGCRIDPDRRPRPWRPMLRELSGV